MRNILQQSWQIYRQHFLVILAVVVIVRTPLDLFSCYMDAFVFGDDFRKSWAFGIFLGAFFGIIAQAGVIFIGYEALTDMRATFPRALATGFTSWGRMWWAGILSGLATLLGFLLLIVPGVYLLVRLSLVEQVVVQEHISGAAAMRRSFALTAGRFWLVFWLGPGLLVGLGILTFVVFALPIMFILGLDHWLFYAAFGLVEDVVFAFGTITLVIAYSHFNCDQTTA